MMTNLPELPKPRAERLTSLDALRGFNIFLLFLVDYIVESYRSGPFASYEGKRDSWLPFLDQFRHTSWGGFSLCDLIMPLFLFMAGVAIPFALAKYIGPAGEKKNRALWIRMLRRVAVLWIFGICVQGNLLDLVPSEFKPYSNTLQAIATGYFFACLAYLYLPCWSRYVLFVLLLAGYWAGCAWITLETSHGTFGGGSFAQGTNLPYGVDVVVLGRWMHYATVENGQVVFAPGYHYSWIYSSLTFVATTLSGMFAGELLFKTREKMKAQEDGKGGLKLQLTAFVVIAAFGALLLYLGKLWDGVPEGTVAYCPIIKQLWTSSMVLYSSGLCLLLLAFFYLIYDICKLPVLKTFFIVLGANAIAAYMLVHIFHFNEIAHCLTYGLEKYIGVWQRVVDSVVGVAIVWLMLWDCWKRGKILRV